jgi:hypothetical protein
MDDRSQVEPGSPLPLTLFTAWCRTQILLALLAEETTDILFVDGPDRHGPTRLGYTITGGASSLEKFLDPLVKAGAAGGRSQIGVCMSSTGWPRQLLLACLDETGLQLEQAVANPSQDGVTLSIFRRVDLPIPTTVWQQQLAAAAGYRSATKWRCRQCRSVCIGEEDERPSPCCYCASGDVVKVELTTPLAPPMAPWDEHYEDEETALLRSPFAQELLGRLARDVQPKRPSRTTQIVRKIRARLRPS